MKLNLNFAQQFEEKSFENVGRHLTKDLCPISPNAFDL